MKPFNASEFISNQETPVVSRHGRPIEVLTVKGRGDRPIVGYANTDQAASVWWSDGRYMDTLNDDWDLFFAPKMEVVHVFRHKESGILVPMIEDADAWIKDADYTHLGTITGPIVPPVKDSGVVK